MTFRDDGRFGFPGGIMEEGETPREAATREAWEEVNASGKDFEVTDEDWLCCHKQNRKGGDGRGNVVLHFFAKEVPLESLRSLERKALDAEMFGTETLGVVRVPLFTFKDSSEKGLPSFLRNQFAGNARLQLLYGIYAKEILSEEEIKKAMKK